LRHALLLVQWTSEHLSPDPGQDRPPLVIYLSGENGNAFALIRDAATTLRWVGLGERAEQIEEEMGTLTGTKAATYQDVRHLAEKYCAVTWIP